MHCTWLLLAAVALLATVAQAQRDRGCCEDYCYDTDNERPQAKRMGTKTAYEFVRGSESVRQFYVPNCTPVKFWLLSRHGTRLPDGDKIAKMRDLKILRDDIIRNYEERRTKPDQGALCDEDLELLKNWHWNANITEDRGNTLTTQGWNDLKYLAIQYQSAFPRLLENIYSPTRFNFRYTNTERTNSSLKGFLEGMFGAEAYEHIHAPAPVEPDMVLKPYDQCPAWKKNSADVKDDDDSEVNKFEEGKLYQTMLEDVSRRLGYKLTLDKKKIKLVYDMCRYDQAWTVDRPSAWCTAFTKSQIQILEYAQDLKYYRESAYGNADLNSNIACATVKDMLHHLDSKAEPSVSAYFAHSSTVQLMLTALGAYRDTVPLRADNFAQMNRRKWRVSELSPFAANLAAIKYDCPNDQERTQVMFFLNQRPMDFSFCNVGLCKWSKVKEMYARFDGADCERTFCKPSKGSRSEGLGVSLVLAVLGAIGQYW